MWQSCPATGRLAHKFDPITHRCPCGRWERGFAPKKEYAKPRDECQICARKQAIDKDGTLGHHGYKRPGWGFIDGDCMGEGYKPYPATDALEKYKVAIQNYLNANQAALEMLPDKQELVYRYTTGYRKERQEHTIPVARGDEMKYLNENGVHVSVPSFEELEKREQRRLQSEISNATKELERVIARIKAAGV
jgi:hypothetical protein